MQRFKKIILPMQGHSKFDLHWLYNTKSVEEPPKIFRFNDLRFWFSGTSYRSSEKLILYIEIPAVLFCTVTGSALPYETYILGVLSPILNDLSRDYQNIDKNVREKAQFEAQRPGEYFVRRSGIVYVPMKDVFVLRLNFNVPLVNALSVNAKACVRAMRDILEHIETAVDELDRDELRRYVRTYSFQQEVRQYMKEHDLCSFVANGSILPRRNGTAKPLENALPFVSPKEMETAIPLSDGTQLTGMGIGKGVTVITGGGYSGKSTLLDAIEMGIYDHIPGDGREYVLTDNSALKIYAEDGRPVSNLDLSPFFQNLPEDCDLNDFSTPHASGSVSQAANVVEAVCGGCRLMLIDEDKSALNFMVCDRNMRRLVKSNPNIPFTDRVRELYETKDVSTILVIGGSSEYLSYADTVILMENYLPHVVTEVVREMELPIAADCPPAHWQDSRLVVSKDTAQPFLYFRSVETENEKKIILDEYNADITRLTALVSEYQLNMLSYAMECLLTHKEAGSAELLSEAETCADRMTSEQDTSLLIPEVAQRFYENVRPLDIFCCANRMRGLHFRKLL